MNITNVFVLMLENHSFDNIFAMSGINGIVHATTANSNAYKGTVYNVTSPAPDSMKPTDPGHEFLDTLEQLAGSGAVYRRGGPYPKINNSGFAANYATTTDEDMPPPTPGEIGDIMACFDTKKQLPALYQLATNFTVCDHWFSSMPGPTWSNRFFVHGASSNGLDHMPTNEELAEWSVDGGFAYNKGSIYDSLDSASLDWAVYRDFQWWNPGGSFPQVLSIKDVHVWDVGDLANFSSELNDPNGYGYTYTFIEPNYGDVSAETYEGGSSQHPMDGMSGGDNLIADVYEAIRNSPLWETSLLIITYDEHGGFYDSVAPGKIAPPNDGSATSPPLNVSGFAFDVAGVRVPTVVVSPLIPKEKRVDHTVYDHSSVLATLEKLFGLNPLTDRDAKANNLVPLLSLSAARSDCPTKLNRLPAPARPAMMAERRAALDLEPLPPSGNLPGFLAIAHKVELELAEGQPQLRAAAIEHFKTIKTRGQARAYMDLIQQKWAAAAKARRK
jgi:phospholipase C